MLVARGAQASRPAGPGVGPGTPAHRSRALVALVCVAVVASAAGCGGSAGAGEEPGAPTAADPLLRTVVRAAPERNRGRVRWVDTNDVRPGTPRDAVGLALVSSVFPFWDPTADRVRGSRVVATDEVVVAVPYDGPQSIDALAPRARLALAGFPRAALEAESRVASSLTAARNSDGVRSGGRRIVRVRDDAAALRAVTGGRADAAVVLRSSVRRMKPEGVRSMSPDPADAAPLLVQVGVRGRGASPPLVRWLVSPAGRRSLASAGFGGPGQNPTIERCTADVDC